jgi:hypothetical protein
MSDSESMVMSMLGCSREEAAEHLLKTNGDVLDAIAQNMKCIEVSGEKYIPSPPKIDDGLTDEVRGKLTEARKLGDMFSASFRNDLLVTQEKKPDEVVFELPVVEGQPPVAQDSQNVVNESL